MQDSFTGFFRIIDKHNLSTVQNPEEGILLLIDKPLHWTSFDVVNKLRYAFKRALQTKSFKVGHAGTLDPMASGLLLVCAGKYTKEIDRLSGMDKSYIATVKLGATTASYDSEAPEENIQPFIHISQEDIKNAITDFQGVQSQIPPIYSAIKMNGQSAYKLARRGEEVEMKAREVTIHNIEVISIDLPYIKLDVTCSKGTYIRSLAHDIGTKLGCGGYLSALVRTAIGDFRIEPALSVDETVAWISEGMI